MSNIYEYSFDNIDDYLNFEYNCYLDCPEILIKPIVVQYHDFPNDLVINHSPQKITVSGTIFEHQVMVTYQPEKITIIYRDQKYWIRGGRYYTQDKWKYITIYDENQHVIGLHPWVYHKGKIPDHLPPPEGCPNATIIIHFIIPELTQYFWSLWNDSLPPFNSICDQFATYTRAFYINVKHENPIPFLKLPDKRIKCNDEVINAIRFFAKNKNGSIFDPLSAHRNLTVACLRWRIYLYVRLYNHVMESILYNPRTGIYYSQAFDDFTKQRNIQ